MFNACKIIHPGALIEWQKRLSFDIRGRALLIESMQVSGLSPTQIRRHAMGLPPIWDVVETYGLTMEQCLVGTGVTRAQALGDEEGFTLEHEFALYRNILHLSGDPLVGLSLGAVYRPETFGILGYAQLSAKNLLELTELNCEFAELSYSHFGFRIIDNMRHFGVELEVVSPIPEDLLQIYCDRDIQSVFTVLQSVGIPPTAPSEVHLMHSDDANRARYEQHFGGSVQFGQMKNAVCMDPSLKNFKLPWSNQEASAHIRASCLEILEDLHTHRSLKSEIMGLMLASPGSFPSMEEIAKQLGSSARNLRRRLKEEDSSYQEILKEVRLQMAKQYLKSGLSVERIAELLDYSEISTFSRAFKSWTGQAPQKYRAR